MKRRSRRILFATLAASTLALFYIGCIHRVHETIEQDGWLLQWNYKPLRCPQCWGRVERFKCDGDEIICPVSGASGTNARTRFCIITPVGKLECFAFHSEWRVMHAETVPPINTCGVISDFERQRGFYEMPDNSRLCKKRGTPKNWCYAASDEYVRWVDPHLIDELPW